MALDDSETVGGCSQAGNGIERLAVLAGAGDEQLVVEQFPRAPASRFHSSAVAPIKSIRATAEPGLPHSLLMPMAKPPQTDAPPSRCLRCRSRAVEEGIFELAGGGAGWEGISRDPNPRDLQLGFSGLDPDDRFLDRNAPAPIWRIGAARSLD